jgi:aspartate/methionine/tyrosine aminotransferase
VAHRPPGFGFDADELEKALQEGAWALVLCNPANPTGRVFSRDELDIIAELARRYDVYVITDEVYEHIVYEPHRHTYMASLPGMFERTLSCSSLSETYAITGWRLGYLIASEVVTRDARKVHDFLTAGAPAPLQEAAVTALSFPPSYYHDLRESYAARRDLLLGYLDRAGLRHTVPQGAYYVLVDIEPFGAVNDTAFCRWLAREVGVAAVPGSSSFGGPIQRRIRLHFAKKDDTLVAAGERLLTLATFGQAPFVKVVTTSSSAKLLEG